MSIQTSNPELSRYLQLVSQVGKLGAHTLFPDDFEYYMVSFELVKVGVGREKVVDFFTFPINPKSISETTPSSDNIKKTSGGVTILSNDSFNPVDIEMSGNFGKRFKFLLGRNLVDFSAISIKTTLNSVKKTIFNSQIKTGYGCIKVLENIIETSKQLDKNNQSYKLYFYNTISGNSFQIKKVVLTKRQSMEENGIWNYSISMKGVAPVNLKKGKLLKLGSAKIIEKGVRITSDIIKEELRTISKKIQSGDIDVDIKKKVQEVTSGLKQKFKINIK